MVTHYKNKKLIEVPIAELTPHPRQGIFAQHTPAQIADLADSLSREGQLTPVEITPDNVIICGHGRVAAAEQLGWPTITCWVRQDLADEGGEAVFRRLAEDNLNRRQLSKLGLARVYLLLRDQLRDEWAAGAQDAPLGDFRDFLGKRLNCDGTTAERWAKLAVLPAFVDAIVDEGYMTFAQAQRLVRQPQELRDQVLDQLAAIAELDLPRTQKKQRIKELLADREPAKREIHKSNDWLAKLCEHCAKVLAELPSQYAEVYLADPAGEPLRTAIDMIRAELPASANRRPRLPDGSHETLRDAATVLLQLVARSQTVDVD